jgi:hypothetical protein
MTGAPSARFWQMWDTTVLSLCPSIQPMRLADNIAVPHIP